MRLPALGLGILLIAGGLLAATRPTSPPVIADIVAPAPARDGKELDVLVMGTSLTRRALWPERLKGATLPCGFRVRSVTVAAVAGAGSRHGLTLVQRLTGPAPDVAIIEYAINDADLVDGIRPGESRANHRRIIAGLRRHNPDVAVVLLATNPVQGLQRLKRPFLARYHRDYAMLALEAGASFFDGPARWAAATLSGGAIPDGLHPDPEAEARLYTAPIRDMLGQGFERSCDVAAP